MHMAATAKVWTLEELHSLPDDGNTYELIRGELFVTPAPSPHHEDLLAVLMEILVGYVRSQRVGRVYSGHAAIVREESEVQPDLMVSPIVAPANADWATRPLPLLVVEIASRSTRRRDREQKRDWYLRLGIPEYWIVDGYTRSVRVAQPGRDDRVLHDQLVWAPPQASEPLSINVTEFFATALG